MFTTHGYSNTSTRRIADAVGIRQASLYHHFATKDDILDALLGQTVASPLDLAARLLVTPGSAAPRLYALAWLDVSQLCASRWNLGALYLLPELRTERFESFRIRRDELRTHYESLASAVITEIAGVAGAEVLPFRLVETVINIRSDNGSAIFAEQAIPDAVLRMLGWQGDIEPVRDAARRYTAG